MIFVLRRSDPLDREHTAIIAAGAAPDTPTFNGKGKPSIAGGELEALFNRNPDLRTANLPQPAGGRQPKISIKDGKHVDVAYPSGREVSYFYNGILSERGAK